MTQSRFIEIWNMTILIIGLILSVAVLSAGVYLFWLLIKVAHKYLAS